MLGVKTTAARRQTNQVHPIQSAAHDAVSQRTSKKTNVVERKIGIHDVENLLKDIKQLHPDRKTALHLNGSQSLNSNENFFNLGLHATSNKDKRCASDSHVIVPRIETQSQSPRIRRLNSQTSYAFGWEAYPTRATRNEVCRRFDMRYHGSDCCRILPRSNPRPPEVQVLTGTVQDQGCRNANKTTHGPEIHSVEEPLPQSTSYAEGLLEAQALSGIVVKLPPKGQNKAPLECTVSRRLLGRSSVVLRREGSSEVASKGHSRDQSNERSSFNRSLPDTSCGLTDIPPPLYSDLQWDPQTGFWGYPIDEHAWTDGIQTSDCSTLDSSSSPREQSTDSIRTDHTRLMMKRPPPRYSEFCRHWLNNRCTLEYSCPFVHGDLEYDPPVTGRHPRSRPKPQTCRRWLRNECNRGYACFYTHGDLEYDSPTQAHPTPEDSPTANTHKPNPKEDSPALRGASIKNQLLPTLTVVVHDHAKVQIAAGFDIRDIITGFETRLVFLDNIPVHVTDTDVNTLLQPFGRVMETKWYTRANSSTKTARVKYSTPAAARQAYVSLNNAQAFDITISTRLPVNDLQKTVFQDAAVRVQWAAPSKVAYGGYSTMERANQAIEAARIPFGDHIVKASVHVGLPVVGAVTVCFRGVPSDANEGDMERFAHPDDVVWERPNYSSLPRAVNAIKRILQEDVEPLSFEVMPPPYRNGATVCAWAHFPTAGDAQAACNRLHGRRPMFTGKNVVFARHFRSLSYSLSPAMHEKLENDIQLLRRAAWLRGGATISVVIRNPLQPVFVKLSGEDVKALGHLKSEFEKILNGEVVRDDGQVAWDGFFARPAGNSFITELEQANPGVTIHKDNNRRMIRLLGSAQNRAKVRAKLLTKLHELRSQRIRTLPLDGQLIGLFLNKDLVMLREELGFENVDVDIQNRNLQIRGNDVAYEAAREAIRRARSRHSEERPSNIAECPVCFNQVTARITLPCGHSWCRACLKDYLISSIDNKYFPLTCLASGAKCTERISLDLVREILTVSEFDAVVNAAFSLYVQSRPDEFHYCPSPDCPQIYRTAASDTVLQCPSCLLRICPNCHVEAHDGFACAGSEDSLFEEWMKNHDVKKCPGCKIPIERAEGCNHMTCTQCQTHTCWVCLQMFPRGEGIYDHMRSVHGGIGLDLVF